MVDTSQFKTDLKMEKSIYKVCAIGVVSGISVFLPLSTTVKGILLVAVIVMLLLVNTDDEKDG